MEINLNECVQVKLTDKGKKTYRKYYASDTNETPDGWIEIQLWELMHIFGNRCFVGAEDLFENNVIYFTPSS